MLQQLSLEDFLTLSQTAKRVAVHREIPADRLTPMMLVENLKNEMRDGILLETGLHDPNDEPCSLIAYGSIAQFSVQNKIVSQRIGDNITTETTHPLTVLRQLMSQLACVSKEEQVNFINGPIGFMTYDAIRLFESISDRHRSEDELPDMFFNFYETILRFDHHKQTLLISIAVEVGSHPEATYHYAQEKINSLLKKIKTLTPVSQSDSKRIRQKEISVNVDSNDQKFIESVERAKQSIIAGDAFQIVLSRCFRKNYTVEPFDIYRALRKTHPAPYLFYFPFKDSVIVGASPEKLISVRNRTVEVNPIAGTRQRKENTNDAELTTELLNDQKELAEHMMLVDLARNDLGAVCEPGSVHVRDLLHVKHYSYISHITSVVTGQLREDKDALDALAASFPAGTLSGAPKIRAMQIIDELETSKRGIYGGAICRLDYHGNLDSCIAIRTAVLKEGVATVRTGAGIVYDSNPLSEANETRQKAKGVLDAITFAEEELA